MIPTDRPSVDWLHQALRTAAHGFDLKLPRLAYDVDQQLLRWERAGWIRRGAFDPDLSQRVLNIVHPDRTATMAAAKEVLERGLKLGVDHFQSAYWWHPGPKAAEILPQLPPREGVHIGDTVKYRSSFLRSIGMTCDDQMLRWRGKVVDMDLKHRILECTQVPVRCHCDVGRYPGNFESDCYRCGGTGRATRMRVAAGNVEAV